jgi:hypothetical protein
MLQSEQKNIQAQVSPQALSTKVSLLHSPCPPPYIRIGPWSAKMKAQGSLRLSF